MEFGVGVLGIPLIVILGHDSCGAVNAAAIDAVHHRRHTSAVSCAISSSG
jgi:carbonic anhydrase